ncbi:MAG TPA: helix-turn-helix transcriptional regulator [Pyrinomonadaceae bacterium]|nr:helix-turn-helix transcriptional regulator [Pyrinomonadaceae bacterium]
MGQKARPQPARLAEKLLQIRTALDVSQAEMFRLLDVEDSVSYKQLSKYELGITEPPLIVLLQYARVAGICVDVLIDDEQDLPEKLPSKPKH